MSFLDRIQNGWSLALSSMQVLRKDPELILFPIASGIACLIVLGSFTLPLLGIDPEAFKVLSDDQFTAIDVLALAGLFLFYFINFFIIIFFNSALVSCAIIRFKGGNPTLKDGIQAAMASIHTIAMWALVAATIGLILKAIESRGESVGRIIAGLLGAAWSILTYFVVPILVVEHRSPWQAFNRSKDLILKTWGEVFVSGFSIGILNFIAILIGLIPIAAGVFVAGSSILLAGILFAIGAIIIISGVLITTTLESILLAGLYLYAEEDRIPDAFDESTFSHAFR